MKHSKSVLTSAVLIGAMCSTSVLAAGTTRYDLPQGYLIDMQGPSTGYVVVFGHNNCVKSKFPLGTKVVQQGDGSLQIVTNSGGVVARLPKPSRITPNPKPQQCQSGARVDGIQGIEPDANVNMGNGLVEGELARPIGQ